MAKSAEVAVDVTGKFTMVSATAAAGLKEWKQRELSRVEWVGWLVGRHGMSKSSSKGFY